MTKENFTLINAIIDQSGSMRKLTSSTIEGFNNFINEQKEVPGEASLTLCLFNTVHTVPIYFKPLAEVVELDYATYKPDGFTALLDAMGSMIDATGVKLASMPEEERPSKVIFLIITDGLENSSREYTREQIKEKVEHQQSVYSWDFVFIGANMDAIAEGGSLGVTQQNSVTYQANEVGTKGLYSDVSRSMRRYRSSGKDAGGFFGSNK